MKIEAGKVYTMRMSYGEEIVAKITAINTDTYSMTKPLSVIPGREGIQLMNSLFTADIEQEITVNKSSVIMIAAVRDDVADSYTEATTGIKPIRSSILMG
jgi:hypothetical protein